MPEPNMKYRSLKCIKHLKLKLPKEYTTLSVNEETGKKTVSHYLEGDVQIGRIMVGYTVVPMPDYIQVTAAYAFGRLSDKKATRFNGRWIVAKRLEKGKFVVRLLNELTSREIYHALIQGARAVARNYNVNWITDKVTIL